jgi:copper ion binding protein
MEKKLSIEGMTCHHCVKRVSKIIGKAEGVSDIRVSLENKEAVFACDQSATDVDAIVQAINDFGFTAAEKA